MNRLCLNLCASGFVLAIALNGGPAHAFMPLPILNANDAALYGRAIALVSTGKAEQAKPLLNQVQDPLLVGTVQALNAPALVSANESDEWLRRNADLPAAAKIAEQRARRGDSPTITTTWSDTVRDPDARIEAQAAVDGARSLWQQGLNAWQAGDWATAESRFGQLAGVKLAPPSLQSAAAYWASRAALRVGHPETSSPYLRQAANFPNTFYGVLARRALGLAMRAHWENDGLNASEMAALSQIPGGKRALALVQLGRADLAEPELRGIFGPAQPDQRAAILRLTAVAGLTALAERMDRAVVDANGDSVAAVLDAAHYPIPPYTPAGGWKVDRALVYAFMRQESGFNPKATSQAGARGLMQVMPATAAILTGDRSFLNKKGKARKSLNNPAISLNLGQIYLARMFAQPDIAGNLIQAAVAYQAGPGNLAKWRTAMGPSVANDPLLFLETLPSKTSRQYAKRVIVNLWVYRSRLGQSTETLDAVIEGQWPRYAANAAATDYSLRTAAK